MQPQDYNDPSTPPTPKPSYDFILNADKKPVPPAKLPLIGGLPKPVQIAAGAILGLLVLIIIYSVLTGGKGANATGMLDLIGRNQEIIRVVGVAQPQIKNNDILDLSATIKTTLTSEQTQMTGYLTSHKKKLDKKKLSLYQDSNTDSSLKSAAQNNTIEIVYLNYLHKSLSDYADSLNQTYKTASKTAQPILQEAYASTQTLLLAPQFKP